MRIAALVLGILACLSGLSTAGLGSLAISLASVGGLPDSQAHALRLVLYGIPILSLVGGGVAMARPTEGGLLMLLSAAGWYFIGSSVGYGTNVLTNGSIILSGIGGILAIAAGATSNSSSAENGQAEEGPINPHPVVVEPRLTRSAVEVEVPTWRHEEVRDQHVPLPIRPNRVHETPPNLNDMSDRAMRAPAVTTAGRSAVISEGSWRAEEMSSAGDVWRERQDTRSLWRATIVFLIVIGGILLFSGGYIAHDYLQKIITESVADNVIVHDLPQAGAFSEKPIEPLPPDDVFNSVLLGDISSVVNTNACDTGCATDVYDLFHIPLANTLDGRRFYLVTMSDLDYCGSSGCASAIVFYEGGKLYYMHAGQGISDREAVEIAREAALRPLSTM